MVGVVFNQTIGGNNDQLASGGPLVQFKRLQGDLSFSFFSQVEMLAGNDLAFDEELNFTLRGCRWICRQLNRNRVRVPFGKDVAG